MRLDELTKNIQSSRADVPGNLADLYAELDNPESKARKQYERFYDPDRKYTNPNIDPESCD